MINNRFFKGVLWMSVVISVVVANAQAQTPQALHIGDPAPAIKYSKWIKGEPVHTLAGDQLYVLEFWATWCGPCKAAMPHLTKLQQEYKGKATFIGVGVWEKVAEGQPYESSLPAVVKFVKGNDANMGYSVVADNNEQFMGNQWLKAAGENGIPSTFIVKNNQIMWIGHPNSLDSTLPKILNGTYDMQAFKSKFDQRAEAGRNQSARMAAIFKPIQDAIKAKDYRKAFALMDTLTAQQPVYQASMDNMKLGALLDGAGEEEAIAFAKTWIQRSKSAASGILAQVYKREGMTPATYLWVANNFGDIHAITNPVVLDAVATCYAKAGDYPKAVISQQRAVELARKALKEGTMIGTIMDYTVKEYEETLVKYQQKAN